jgi:hypothetical protein
MDLIDESCCHIQLLTIKGLSKTLCIHLSDHF